MKKLNSEERFIILLIIVTFCGLILVKYGKWMQQKTLEDLTIENVTEEAVYINYGGEVHYYSYN